MYTRDDWKRLADRADRNSIYVGGHFDRGVNSIHVWAGPDDHPDNWDDGWAFFHGDRGLLPRKRAFIGWVATGGWSETEGGFEHFEVRTRNVQAMKTQGDVSMLDQPDAGWQAAQRRSPYLNRREDLQWVKRTFRRLYGNVFPDRDPPDLQVTEVDLQVPEGYPESLNPRHNREESP